MDDDGLLLNFAAPSTSTNKVQPRRSQGKSQNRKSNTTASSREEPKLSSVQKTLNGSTQKSLSDKSPAASSSASPLQEKQDSHRNAQPTLPRASSSKAAITNSHSRTKEAPGLKKGRGTAVISSLFAGEDALQNTNEKQTQARKQLNPTNAPSKASDFSSLQLDPLLIAHISSEKMKITRPTSIQKNALPFLLSPSSFERDALLHAQTGSGKTLCYLLPIIQSLLPFCQSSWIDRSCLGTLAIILAPTRELARQIYEVAESICSLHLTSKAVEGEEDDEEENGSTIRRTRWIIPGLLSGGATKNHEKSRLRKGLPLIVATPGRLLDHLRNTAALDVGRLQWLVLDEADRLLQLGFEETLNDISKAIEGRRRAACDVQRQRMRDELGNQFTGQSIDDSEVVDTFGEAWWKHGRRTVLCSATLDEGVQVLAGKNLRQPKLIRSEIEDENNNKDVNETKDQSNSNNVPIAAPAQLSQYYTIAPTKQRLVLLVALLRKCISSSESSKIMVFLSCTDSVDFHLAALAGVSMSRETNIEEGQVDEQVDDEKKIEFKSSLLPSTALFKLHGSLSAHSRQASLRAFSKAKGASVLLCTSVASRGLDLHVSHVVQVDAPTEKGADEYLHRIGRTARAGERGESWLFLLPSEEGCVQHYESAMGKERERQQGSIQRQEPVSILRDGFGGQDLLQTQTRATDAQMALERWTIINERNLGLARQAYLSHLRAYASHPPIERTIFSIAKLQLGHLAKAFALREAPGTIRAKVLQQQKDQKVKYMGKEDTKKRKRNSTANADGDTGEKDQEDQDDIFENGREIEKLQFQRNEDTEARMYAKVREMGKLHKRQGVMGNFGAADEFQIA